MMMMRSYLCLGLMVLLFAQSRLAAGADLILREEADERITRVITDGKVIADSVSHRATALRVRLFLLPVDGECGETLSSCPKQDLIIGVANFDLLPDRRVYWMPSAYGWKFKKWVRFPRTEDATDFVVFEVEKKTVEKDKTGREHWRVFNELVSVNLTSGLLRGD